MMNDDVLLRRRLKTMGPAYRLFYEKPVHLVRGEGVWLFDASGKKYLDCYNNVASVGHCHPRVVAALHQQAATLNTHTRYLHENAVEYSERLGRTLPAGLSVCMFVCTGTEANDLAFRMARSVTGNDGAIVLEDAYHGNSTVVTELSTEMYAASDRPSWLEAVEAPNVYRGGAGPGGPGLGARYAAQVDGAVEALAGRGHKPAVFINDLIYSSNGILTPPPTYLQSVYEKVRAAGGLVIADEVQSGFCRLGEHFWGFEDSGVVPDIVTLGKPAGNGHPLAAVVTTPEIAAEFAGRFHYFNTFGGNPVSAAVGLAVLDVIERENLLGSVGRVGAELQAGLRELQERHACIGDVRGKGLFFGIEIVADRTTREADEAKAIRIREHLRDNGVLLGTTGPHNNVIKIRPPMVFSAAHAALLLDELDQALSQN